MIKYFLSIAFVLLFNLSFAQSHHENENHDNHHHGDWEIGVGAGIVPLLDEKEVAFGVHLHLLRSIENIKGFRVGLGLENVFDEHNHFNTGIVFNYNLVKGLFVSFSPGYLIIHHENQVDKGFSSHFELNYEFEFNKIHIGPVLEYSLSKFDKHFMIGIHTGFSF